MEADTDHHHHVDDLTECPADAERPRDTVDDRFVALQQAIAVRDATIDELVRQVDGLQISRQSRAVIEQAKGVIMASTRCSADAAFALLVAQSQAENRKLHDIAAEIASAQDRHADI